jgi:DNA-binding transcriptional ArsR family regulator
MAGWISSDEPVLAVATAVARELADPIRLTVLQLLAHEGPHGMSQLAEILQVTPSRLGNHLGKLRAADLVTTETTGRHVTYRLADPAITPLLDALAAYAGGTLPTPSATASGDRLCYDHAAGRVGVALLDHLTAHGALVRQHDTDELAFGPAAASVLAPFGLVPADLGQVRRKLATSCLDRSLRRPHLGGALGHALLLKLTERGLVGPDPATRSLTVSAAQRRRLTRLLPALAK